MKAVIAAMAACLLSALPAGAAKIEVDLQLALGSDVSRSVDEDEASLQRAGYIKAFQHPAILQAIQRGALGRIAVMYFEWGGTGVIRTVVDWTILKDKQTVGAFTARLMEDFPMSARRTGISGAIQFATESTRDNKFTSLRRVIDLSGDGANNSGLLVNLARDEAVKNGFIINGLPIVNDRESGSGWRQIENLDLYYRDCVIGGPGAFYVVAKDFKDFGRAIMRKLIIEIAGLAPPKTLIHRAQFAQRKGPPCDIGEIRRRQRWGTWNDDDWLPLQPPRPGGGQTR